MSGGARPTVEEALRFYGEKAEALERYARDENGAAIEAVVVEMTNDGGSRARRALAREGAARREDSAVGWRPVEEAPKDGTQIIVTDGTNRLAVRWWPIPGAWGESAEHAFTSIDWTPTHWTPLPAPPTSPAPDGDSDA